MQMQKPACGCFRKPAFFKTDWRGSCPEPDPKAQFWPRDPPHTELDCGYRDEGHEGLREVFEVFCEASVSAKP
jgi:hypothetical protein